MKTQNPVKISVSNNCHQKLLLLTILIVIVPSSSLQYEHSYKRLQAGPPPKVECKKFHAFCGTATQSSLTKANLVGSTPPWGHRKSELSTGPKLD